MSTASRRVAVVMGAAFTARLPIVGVNLLLALLLRDAGVAYGTVGAVLGAYIVGSGVTSPVLGRLADRHATRVLVASVTVYATALVVIALMAHRLPVGVVIGLAVVAGLAFPPLTPVLRATLPGIADGDTLRTAYAMEAALQETLFVVGPLVVVAAIRWLSPGAALAVSAVLIVLATVAFAGVVRRTVARADGPRARGWALRSVSLRLVVTVYGLMGMALGLAELGAIGVAERAGHRDMAGAVLAAWSMGSLCGGLVAARRARGDALRRLSVLIGVMVLLTVPLMVLSAGPVTLAVGLAVHGAVIAPALAAVYEIIPRAAPDGLLTEAFGWSSTFVYAGIGTGNALAGVLLAHTAPAAVYGACTVALAIGWAVSRRLRRMPMPDAGSGNV